MRTLLFLGILAILVLLLLALPSPAGYEWRPLGDDQLTLWYDGVQIGGVYIADGSYYQRVSPGVWEGPCPCPTAIPPGVGRTEAPYKIKVDKVKPPRTGKGVEPAKSCACGYGCDCGRPDDCLCPPSKNPASGKEVAKASKKMDCPCCGDDCPCAVKPCGKPSCHCVLSSEACHIDADGIPNFGIGREEVRKGQHILNGKEVSKQELIEAISEGASVPNDADWMFVTVIGADGVREPVLKDLQSHPALVPYKGKVRVQGYAPDHWAVADSGFVTTGSPTIYCQAPDGQVLHRQDDYKGPEDLAKAMEKAQGKLRGVDPNYQPAKDPNLNKPLSLPSSLHDVPVWVWVVGGIALFLFFSKNKENK